MIPEDQEPMSLDPHDELLRWHYRLGHLPFDRIKKLSLKGQLPKRLLASKKPFCPACHYGKMTKIPWKVKEQDVHIAWVDCIGGPIGVQLPGPYRPAQGQSYSTMLQVCDSL